MAVLRATLIIGLACSPAARALAQSGTAFDDMEPGLSDAAYLGIVLPLDIGLELIPPAAGAPATPSGFDLGARELLKWDHPLPALHLSDVLLGSLVLGGLWSPLIGEWSADSRELSAFIVAMEAMSTVALLTDLTKRITGRQRPYAWEAGLDEAYASFFSGHASGSFASATLITIFAHEYEWLSDDTRWVIPASAYTLAAFTAYLRVAGDAHWLTDVLVGALIGTGASYLTYAVRAGQ